MELLVVGVEQLLGRQTSIGEPGGEVEDWNARRVNSKRNDITLFPDTPYSALRTLSPADLSVGTSFVAT